LEHYIMHPPLPRDNNLCHQCILCYIGLRGTESQTCS